MQSPLLTSTHNTASSTLIVWQLQHMAIPPIMLPTNCRTTPKTDARRTMGCTGTHGKEQVAQQPSIHTIIPTDRRFGERTLPHVTCHPHILFVIHVQALQVTICTRGCEVYHKLVWTWFPVAPAHTRQKVWLKCCNELRFVMPVRMACERRQASLS